MVYGEVTDYVGANATGTEGTEWDECICSCSSIQLFPSICLMKHCGVWLEQWSYLPEALSAADRGYHQHLEWDYNNRLLLELGKVLSKYF